jgi:UDP-glucose 4-epimerase
VIKVAEAVTGKRIPLVMSARRRGDPAVLVASSTRAKDTLGWTPSYLSLEPIIASAWQWHKEHPHGYRGR